MTRTETPEIHSLPTHREVYYPASDGKPIAETDMHRNLLVDAFFMVQHHFQKQQDVYVSADLLLYYEEGNPQKSVVPDVFVVFGVEKKNRDNYLLWEEGKEPDFVLEISHRKTYDYDLGEKKRIYAEELGVKEYFTYDPDHFLRPALQGYRLIDGAYHPIQLVSERFVGGWLRSEVLGLEIGLKTRELDFYNPQSGRHLLTSKEWSEIFQVDQLEAQLEQEIQARKLAEARAEKAEAELAQLLRTEIERLRVQQTNDR